MALLLLRRGPDAALGQEGQSIASDLSERTSNSRHQPVHSRMPSPGTIGWTHAATNCSTHSVSGPHHSIGMVGCPSVRARGDVPVDSFGTLGPAPTGFDSHGGTP